MSCLILFKSITYAQNGNARLLQHGITSYIIRKPSELEGTSCGYALKLNCNDIEKAKETLKNYGIHFTSCWQSQRNKWYSI